MTTRRTILTGLLVAGSASLSHTPLHAAAPRLSQGDAALGIKESLAQGTRAAISRLGRPDGFLKDRAVRILLPGNLSKLAETARKLGASKQVDALELAMNRAAEKAVASAADIFADAVRDMSVNDALAIVRGGDDAGTQYFRRTTEGQLRERFRPIVESATSETEVAKRYKSLSKKAGGLDALLGGGEAVDLDGYVTEKAMDGLFHYIGEEEKAIRKNPVGRGSELLQRVFGR